MAQPNANQDYTPIKTNADRRAEAVSHANDNVKEVLGVEGNWGDHLKHRLSLKTIIKEVLNTITDRIIPQGRNEITNALFSQPGGGSGYWPGEQPASAPIAPPEQGHGVHGAPAQDVPTVGVSESLNAYSMGDYAPPHQDHANAYTSGQAIEPVKGEAPSFNYEPARQDHGGLYMSGEAGTPVRGAGEVPSMSPEPSRDDHRSMYVTDYDASVIASMRPQQQEQERAQER